MEEKFTVAMARRRAAMMEHIRTFFRERDVLEVETPVLGHGVSTDCHIDPFITTYTPAGATVAQDPQVLYMQTSPELHMKRLLIDGFPDIFQICKVFRDGELGRIHNPEFTMLEWYRHGFSMFRLIDEVDELLCMLCGTTPARRVTYRDLFMEYTGIDPLEATLVSVNAALRGCDAFAPEFADTTDALMYTMAMVVEPQLDPKVPLFVYGFPRDQAVLSVVDPDDSRTARRFELYYGGMELANGFEELVDAEENRRRLEDESRKRCLLGMKPVEPDAEFCRDLIKGMPHSSGVAVGLDRILLCAEGCLSINKVISFGWNHC